MTHKLKTETFSQKIEHSVVQFFVPNLLVLGPSKKTFEIGFEKQWFSTVFYLSLVFLSMETEILKELLKLAISK